MGTSSFTSAKKVGPEVTGQSDSEWASTIRRQYLISSVDSLSILVCGTSKLSAAPDEHLVWSGDRVHAIVDSVEKTGHVDRLRASRSTLLRRLHNIAQ